MSSTSINNESKDDVKTSRIKFKNFSPKLRQSYEFSKSSIDKKSLVLKTSSSFIRNESELDSSVCYHPECSFAYNFEGDVRNESLLVECLPSSTYRRLAELWDLDPQKYPQVFGNKCKKLDLDEEDKKLREFMKNVERDIGLRSDISEDLVVNVDSTKKSEGKFRQTEVRDNPYYKFIKRQDDLNTEQKNKTNLRRKAKRITEMIIKNFLDWYQSLGGNDSETVIDDYTLKELFQIGFDFPAARALVVKIREMPTVPDFLAALSNEPKHATRYGLKQLLKQDIIKENIPLKMFAFGNMLPKEKPSLRYKPPKNFVKQTWMECSRVPEDLDTMKTVWAGLEKLRSTIAFANWLKNHSKIKPPTYLQQRGLMQINYEEWNQMYKGFEIDVDTMEVVTSEMKVQEKSSRQDSKLSVSSSGKYDSYDSF